jgi:RNA polymerase sigma factor (sigma-70 family)
METLPFTLQVRGALLQLSLPLPSEAPPDSLRQRLYRAAITLVPPGLTAHRGASSPAHRTDEALLADFLRGDASAFEGLMTHHLQWMHAWALKSLPPHEADDAVQEAFTSLLQKAHQLPSRAPLRGLLFGFLRISVLRARRSLSRRRGEPLDDEPLNTLTDDTSDPEVALLTQRSHAELAQALENSCTLTEQEVLLFTLEAQDDRTIASALDLTVGNVRVLRHRAMAKLRQALAPAPVPAQPGARHGR